MDYGDPLKIRKDVHLFCLQHGICRKIISQKHGKKINSAENPIIKIGSWKGSVRKYKGQISSQPIWRRNSQPLLSQPTNK